ncbi:MAG: hypothetical protein V3S00_03315 [Dehalococcoidia bacterium]
MTEEATSPVTGMEDILQRLEEAKQQLLDSLEHCAPERFAWESSDGDSLKRILERTADDIGFHYGRLVAQALSLPPPPCSQKAEFESLREATVSLQVAQRRFSNLLHDLSSADLERTTVDTEQGTYTLKQLLEMAIAHYRMRVRQVGRVSSEAAEVAQDPA